MQTTIMIIDDHQLYREGLRHILNGDDDLQVVHVTTLSDSIIAEYEEYKPQIIFVDGNSEKNTILNEMLIYMSDKEETQVALLSDFVTNQEIAAAIQKGVVGFLLKDMDSQEFIAAVKELSNDNAYIHPKISKRLLLLLSKSSNDSISLGSLSASDVQYPLHILTHRECEVLQLLAAGKNNRDIGVDLYISEKTVKNHVSSILKKLDVADRTQAVLKGIRNNWVGIS
ncbi:hypothetical protein BFR38_03880 [Brochothrix thermosphacta]|uniref:response regulator transcription factor n=1 Tax=Brochothrix thermosphacta TaxID=2756 RepID=UPI00083F8033|nr:response regulator transcription factor [Brochothrix thermosphacta]ODJ51284.1 hypothetical protein BFR38_03880 [Brochothrix thermosphacta]ODJ55705.1 hypothetical protein BFR42_05805 [Brochothrix thermosphacta]